MRGLRATLSVSVDVESYYLRSHGAFYCCCRYEDDSCLRCEIVHEACGSLTNCCCYFGGMGLWSGFISAVGSLKTRNICGKIFQQKKRFFFFARSPVMKLHGSWAGCALKWAYFI